MTETHPQGKVCSINECDNDHEARGWCKKHYKRWKRNGDPTGQVRTEPGEPLRWLREVFASVHTDACIPMPTKNTKVVIDGNRVLAYRVVCEWEHGPCPVGMECAHSCGNGHLHCVNRKHVRWDTHANNLADKYGHGTAPIGEQSPVSKLTENQVRAIRTDERHHNEVAAEYGIDRRQVQRIRARETWAWMK